MSTWRTFVATALAASGAWTAGVYTTIGAWSRSFLLQQGHMQLLKLIAPAFILLYALVSRTEWWDNVRGRGIGIRANILLSNPRLSPDHYFFHVGRGNGSTKAEEWDELDAFCDYVRAHSKVELPPGAPLLLNLWRVDTKDGGRVGDDGVVRYLTSALDGDRLGFTWLRADGTRVADPVPFGTLGELRAWISKGREDERFYVVVLLLGLAALVVGGLDYWVAINRPTSPLPVAAIDDGAIKRSSN
jgi:hypothetical protein